MSAVRVKKVQTWRERWIEKDPVFYCQGFLIGIPVALQQAVNIGVNLMDTVMVGTLGENALSASSLAGQYYYLYYILCMGISGGACVLSAQYWGAGNERMVKQVWRLCMYISSGSALLFGLITAFFPMQIMSIYTNNQEMIALGGQYLRVTAWVFFFHGTSLIMVNLMRTVGVLYLGLLVSGLSFASNIFFNYIFIFGKLGAPCLGIGGAAVGTLISRILEFAITFGYLFLRCEQIDFTPCDLIGKLDAAMLHAFSDTGMPPIISDGMFTVGDNVLSVILGHMGAAVVSGQAITLATMRFCTAFILGLCNASSVMVGHTIGRGKVTDAERQGRTFFLLSVVGGIFGGVIIAVVSAFIVDMYNLSPESRDATMQMMQAMSLLMVFQSVQSVMGKGVLRGGGDTRFLMVIDVVFMWGLNIPFGYLAGLRWGWTPFWVFICLKIDTVCKSFVCLWRLIQGKWIKNVNETCWTEKCRTR